MFEQVLAHALDLDAGHAQLTHGYEGLNGSHCGKEKLRLCWQVTHNLNPQPSLHTLTPDPPHMPHPRPQAIPDGPCLCPQAAAPAGRLPAIADVGSVRRAGGLGLCAHTSAVVR